MSKSILIIDTPSSCKECMMACAGYHSDYCFVTRNIPSDIGHYARTNTKPKWCPLKPVPEKQYEGGSWTGSGYVADEFPNGWNACIEEILGG